MTENNGSKVKGTLIMLTIVLILVVAFVTVTM